MLQPSINSFIDWRQVLPLLDVEAKEGSMPMIVRCPLCRAHQLTIYDDNRFGGNWHYCNNCKSSGDLIVLASKVWGVSILQTILRLADAGATIPEKYVTDQQIAKYESRYAGLQEACKKMLWNATYDMHANRTRVRSAITSMALLMDPLQPSWPKRMGRFMGGASRGDVYKAIFNRPELSFGVLSKTGRVLDKAGWRDVIVIPFHTLPQQCATLLFYGIRGMEGLSTDLHVIDCGPGVINRRVESGLCMYDVLCDKLTDPYGFGNVAFVFNDPIVALRLQARHMRDTSQPLPLVSSRTGEFTRGNSTVTLTSQDVWTTCPKKQYIFWNTHMAPEIFDSAAMANGLVCISPIPETMTRQAPHTVLSFIQQNARPWMVVLDEQLQLLNEEEAVEFIRSLLMVPECLQQFRRHCSTKIQELLDRNSGKIHSLSTVQIKKKTIVESDVGWFINDRKPECVSNAVIRMVKILCDADDEDAEPIVSGFVLYDKKSYPFQTTLSTINKNAGSWLKKFLLRVAGELPVVRNSWNTDLFDIARQFHEPQVVVDDKRFGWRPKKSCFRLPQFSVNIHGEIDDTPADIVEEFSPGTELGPPVLGQDIGPLLCDTPANRLFWAAISCLCANILAPAIGKRTAGIGLVGRGSILVGRSAAFACGSAELRAGCISVTTQDKTARRIDEITGRHNWPLVVSADGGGGHKMTLSTWLNGAYNRNIVTPLGVDLSYIAGILGPWRFIRENTPIAASMAIHEIGKFVIPHWLKCICENQLKLPQGDSYIQQIAMSLRKTFNLHGDASLISKGADLVDDGSADPENSALQFVRLLMEFLQRGRMRFVHEGEHKKNAIPKIVRIAADSQRPAVFVGKDALHTVLANHTLVFPDHQKITEALQIAGALRDECAYNGDNGWLIDDEWWHLQVEKCHE